MKTFSKIMLVIFITLITCTGFGCANKDEKKAAHVKNGDEYFDAREYKKAEIEYKNALQIDNKDTAVLLKLGDIFMKTGQLKSAFALYSSVEKLDPENIEALVKLSRFYFLDKKLPETQARIDKILTKDPQNLNALFLKGQVLIRKKQIEDARIVFEKILEIQNSHVGALHAMAAIKAGEKNSTRLKLFCSKLWNQAKIRQRPETSWPSSIFCENNWIKQRNN